MGAVFRFKEFEVNQEGSAMKINTDGVLLGAMATYPHIPHHILDLGSGTGVIALMLAQRYPSAHIHAVEIDPQAARCTSLNFQHSTFSDRLQLIEGSFETIKEQECYDWIVSNPPFYTNSLHTPDKRKQNAKHTDIAFFESLLAFASDTLKNNGEFHLILPTALASEVVSLAMKSGLSTVQTISIRSYAATEVIRQIIVLRKGHSATVQEADFVIYAEKGKYSEAYQRVLQPFFLAF